MVGQSGGPLFLAVCGDYLAVLREQITAAVGCWSFQVRVTKALWVFRGHKKPALGRFLFSCLPLAARK